MSRRLRKHSLHSWRITDRKRFAADLAASLAAQRDTIAAGLERELGPMLREGEELPDMRQVLRLLERMVRHGSGNLDDADAERWLAGMRMSVARWESRKVHGELHREMCDVRKAMVDLYGSARCRRLFKLSERTPRGMENLAREARRLVTHLEDPGLALPEPRRMAPEANPDEWLDRLRAPLERLEALLDERKAREAAISGEVDERLKALEANDETSLGVLRLAQALYLLAGHPELASRLRAKMYKRLRKVAWVPRAEPAGWRVALAAAGRKLRRLFSRAAA